MTDPEDPPAGCQAVDAHMRKESKVDASTAQGPPVLVERRGRAAWLTLNRPETLNVVTRDLLEALLDALETLAGDDDVRAVVLTGSGRAFCAGGDLSESLAVVTGPGSLAHQTAELRRLMRTSQLLVEMDKVTIAAVNGACAGAGLALACAADIRIASDTAAFVTAFVNVGVSGDFGGTWGLSRAVGPGVARELYLTSRRLRAEDALRLGLVSEVVSSAELTDRVHEVAVDVTSKAPLALAAVKRNFNTLPASLTEVLELEAANHAWCTSTEDAEEARRAFLEKRQGQYTGR